MVASFLKLIEMELRSDLHDLLMQMRVMKTLSRYWRFPRRRFQVKLADY